MSSKLTTRRRGRKVGTKNANATAEVGGLESRINSCDPKSILVGHRAAQGRAPFSGLRSSWGTRAGEFFIRARALWRCNGLASTAV